MRTEHRKKTMKIFSVLIFLISFLSISVELSAGNNQWIYVPSSPARTLSPARFTASFSHIYFTFRNISIDSGSSYEHFLKKLIEEGVARTLLLVSKSDILTGAVTPTSADGNTFFTEGESIILNQPYTAGATMIERDFQPSGFLEFITNAKINEAQNDSLPEPFLIHLNNLRNDLLMLMLKNGSPLNPSELEFIKQLVRAIRSSGGTVDPSIEDTIEKNPANIESE